VPEQSAQLNLIGEAGPPKSFELTVTLDYAGGFIQVDWREAGQPVASLKIRCTGLEELTWELADQARNEAGPEVDRCSLHRSAIRARLVRLSKRFPVVESSFLAQRRAREERGQVIVEPIAFEEGGQKWAWLENQIVVKGKGVIHFTCKGK